VATGNLALVPQGSRQLKTIDHEGTFTVAVIDQRLAQVGEAGLKNALQYVFALVGLRAVPVAAEKEFLHQYILKNYGGHTPAEIQLAFDMAVQGQLELDPRDVRCYENFSVIYFATIMRAYRSWAVEQAKRMERNEPPPVTQEQLEQIDREYLDYLAWVAFQKQKEIDQLPTTIKRWYQCKKELAKIK
jgi:hypothetical protein